MITYTDLAWRLHRNSWCRHDN